MKLQESGEMYLETIKILSEELDAVRSIDICAYMNYSKPSVSRAVKNLKNEGYIDVDKNGHITLTDTGLSIAETIHERHVVLSSMLMGLGVDEKTALEDACRMEHVISAESFEAIKAHLKQDHPETFK